MMRSLLLALGLIAGLTATTAGPAQTPERDWAGCRGDDPEAVIAGCTAVLGSSGLTDGERNEALSIRAFAYRFRRDYPHAIADYQEALRLSPRAIWAHSGLGKAYGASGDHRRAIGEYDIALGLAENELGGAGQQSPEYGRRLARIGQILYDRGGAYEQVHDDERAMRDYRDGMRRVPQDADLGNALCWLLAIRGESLDEARSACDRSLRIRPDHPPTLDSRGLVGLKQRRFQDAWNDYDAAVRLQPRGPSWLYGRGIAALRLGRTEEGRADIAGAEALNDGIAQFYVDLGMRP
jgi:tetratricopeptide (TPR) repeat protein